RSSVDPSRAPQLHDGGLHGALVRRQLLGLEVRRLSGDSAAKVAAQVARVEPAHTADIAGGADAETEVGLVRPVGQVVPALPAGPGVVGDFVVLEAGRAKTIERRRVH